MIYVAKIEGLGSLLQHRFGEAAEGSVGQETRSVKLQDLLPREQAEAVCYRDADGTLYHPGAAVARLLREAGAGHKQKGTRKSLKYVVPAAVIVLDDHIPLSGADGAPLVDYEVDSRPVVIPATKGRVMRHRPRLDVWRMSFTLEVDETVLDAKTVHLLLEEGGRRLGLGDFRPEKGGPFGRFAVVGWQKQ